MLLFNSRPTPASLLMTFIILGQLTQITPALRCYICNSRDEPSCKQNPPEDLVADCAKGRQIGKYPRDPVPDASVCWIQRQDVGDTSVVVRHCGGWASTDNGTSTEPTCYDRVGSKGVRTTYCRCNKDLCNSARPSAIKAPLMIATLATVASGLLLVF